MKKNIGLVLSGGGARGAYQIGALKVLKDAGILNRVKAFSGSSVGSLNAVLAAMGDIDKAEQLWLNIDKNTVFKEERSFIKKLFQEGKGLIYKGYYNTEAFEKLIEATIEYDKVYQNDIYVTVSHVGGEDCTITELLSLNLRNFFSHDKDINYVLLKDLSESDIKKTLMASCAIPIVFKPVTIKNETYYDGGILDDVPIKPLVDAGCEEIIVIDLFRMRLKRNEHYDQVRVHKMRPSANLRGVMDFSNKQIIRRFELGVKDATEFVEKIFKPI